MPTHYKNNGSEDSLPRRVLPTNPGTIAPPDILVQPLNGLEAEYAASAKPCHTKVGNCRGLQPQLRMQNTTLPEPIVTQQRQQPAALHSKQKPGHSGKCINRLALPRYNTIIRKQQEINTLEQLEPVMAQNFNELAPDLKSVVTPNVNQKLNFPSDSIVFKNLTQLNVNDSVMEPERRKLVKFRANKENAKKGPQEPVLVDYLEPIQRIAITVPESPVRFEFPIQEYNFLAGYQKLFRR